MKKKLNHSSSRKRTVGTEDTEQRSAGDPAVTVGSLDDDEERGFGGWLKSPDGLETMKLFIIANSIVMLTTLVYPHLQTAFGLVYDMVYGEDGFY